MIHTTCSRLAAMLALAVLLLAGHAGAQAPHPTSRPAAAQPEGPVNVAFLLVDGVYNSELMAPWDIFHHVQFHTSPGMNLFSVGRTTGTVKTFEGLSIKVDYGFENTPRIDVLVVPSAQHSLDTDLDDERLIAWVRAVGKDARYVLSVCDGAFVLAEAGLLDGYRSTTFPGDIAAFRKRYPQLTVVEGVSVVADGNAFTGAGGARSYDPAMLLVEHLFGSAVAQGVARGMVIDWDHERLRRYMTIDRRRSKSPPGVCWLPGDTVDPQVTVQDAEGKPKGLGELVAQHPGTKAVVLCALAGAEAAREGTSTRGGFWCEDTFSEIANLRYLRLRYADKGVLFVGVLSPPVFHETRFGYDRTAFRRPDGDPVYERNRKLFVERTAALAESDMLPFDVIAYDPRLELLGRAPLWGPNKPWQGKFKWFEDDQTYGTPTTWVLGADLRVPGPPFSMNVYESEGRKIRYTVRDVENLIDRVLGAP